MTTALTAPPRTRSVPVVGTPAAEQVGAVDRGRILDAVLPPALGALAGGVALIGAGTPSFWGDEAATVMSAQRSLPSLALELSRIDAVHGFYYLLMHGWFRLVGADEFTARVPSAVAAALAVAGVVLLGRRLYGRATGLLAGAVLAVLPEFTKLAIEARSYELDVAAATWLTVLLVSLIRRRSRGRRTRLLWALYAVGAAAAIWLWAFMGILLAVHVVVLVALRARRAEWSAWLLAVGVAALLSAPIAIVAFTQRKQVAFLAARGYATPQNVFVSQWFDKPAVAVVAWALLAAGVVAAVRMRGIRRRRAVAVAAWAFGPTALILTVHLIHPIYNQRYLAFSMPAVALGIAVGIAAIAGAVGRIAAGTRIAGGTRIAAGTRIAGGTRIAAGTRIVAGRRGIRPMLAGVTAVALAGVLALTAAPSFAAQRQPYGKQGADVRQAGEVLHALASPGDAVVYDRTIKPSQRPRMIAHLYPADVAGLDDVALQTPYDQRAGIWDSSYPVSEVADRLAGHHVVWALEVKGSGSPDLAELRAMGYTVTAKHPVNRTVVYRLEKEKS